MKSANPNHMLIEHLVSEKKAYNLLTLLINDGAPDQVIMDQDKIHTAVLHKILHLEIAQFQSFHLKTEFLIDLVKREYGEDTLIETALEALSTNLQHLINADSS
jgi:hypothetical protein